MSNNEANKVKAAARLVRLPNLFIVAGTQYLLYYGLLIPEISRFSIDPILEGIHFSLFVLVTVLITASGNIINDLTDHSIDLINRPNRVVVGRIWSPESVHRVYWSINLLGAVIACYLAFHVQQPLLVLIYPAAVGLLVLYSTHLKKKALWGNLLVSLFCAGVAGIIWFAERKAIGELRQLAPESAQMIRSIILWYMVFAFCSTLYREIIKDIEDVQGDRTAHSRTLPLLVGMSNAKKVAGAVAVMLLAFVAWMAVVERTLFSVQHLCGLIIFVVLPLVYSLYYLIIARQKQQFHRLSRLAKLIMLGGLLLLLMLVF
jgi:4-hydroxybenzoate polyprenyltransferase